MRFPWPGRVFPYSAQVHQASTHLNSYCDFFFFFSSFFFFPFSFSFFFSAPTPIFFSLCVPALEDRTSRLVASVTEDMTPRGPEPIPHLYLMQIRTARPAPAKKRRVHRHRPHAPGTPAGHPHLPDHTQSVAALEKAYARAGFIYIVPGPALELRLASTELRAGRTRTLRTTETWTRSRPSGAAMGAPSGKINRPRTVTLGPPTWFPKRPRAFILARDGVYGPVSPGAGSQVAGRSRPLIKHLPLPRS